MTLRELMLSRMYEEIGNPNGCSRYGSYFYATKLEDNKQDRKFNARAKQEQKYNIHQLDNLDDEQLFDAYNKFARRYSTWM